MHRVFGGMVLLVVACGIGAGLSAFGRTGSEARMACEASGGRMIYPMATLGALFAGRVPPPTCVPKQDGD